MDTEVMHDGRYGRPSQMAISDGFELAKILVMHAQILTGTRHIVVHVQDVNHQILKLIIRQVILLKFSKYVKRKLHARQPSPFLLRMALNRTLKYSTDASA